MSLFNCEICGQPATVHMTIINDGVKSNRHLCQSHAQAEGFPTVMSLSRDQIQGILSNLRGKANFIKRYGRTPSTVEELREGIAMKGEVVSMEIKDAELAKRLACTERLIRFVETHGRMPQTPDELAEVEGDFR